MVCRYDMFSSFISRCNLSAVAKRMKLCWCTWQYEVKCYRIRWQPDWEKGSALKWVAIVSRWMELSKKKKKVTHQRKMHASNWDLSYRAHTQTHSNYRHCKSHAQLHRNMCRNRNPFLYILFYNPKAPSHLTARTCIIEMQNVYMDITMTAIFQCIKL